MWVAFSVVICKIIRGEIDVVADSSGKVLLKIPSDQDEQVSWLQTATKNFNNLEINLNVVDVEGETSDYEKVCDALSGEISLVLDISWYGSEAAKEAAEDMNLPYVRADLSISPFLRFLDKFLDYRNSSDVVIIFDDAKYVDQSLYYFMDTTRLRMIIMEGLDNVTGQRLKDLRPVPNNIALVASTSNMTRLLETAFRENLVQLPERWNLVFLDFSHAQFDRSLMKGNKLNILALSASICCSLQATTEACNCPGDLNIPETFSSLLLHSLASVFDNMIKANVKVSSEVKCNTTSYDEEAGKQFWDSFEAELERLEGVMYNDSGVIRMNANGSIEIGNETVASYVDGKGVVIQEGKKINPIKAFYRIGTTHALPWAFQETNPETGELYWTGYCIDFVQKLSENMNFDYILVPPKKGTFGEKINGTWDGVIGDLATGETDMAFTAMVMTADKEEVVDFIAPYFEQSGISIVMRKPVRKTSLFKFMTVLKVEVWLSIVGALVVTGFMVWFLDKYSPYSARNNKKAYPYPCRDFTLKESFWFALTSFTPQGGGEAPKALSGRTLVAAYWLFVVLMLATFTANLAAFLTVERMQTPVQSLEQLARQSRINYTVVMGSDTHKYFINMKHAEDTLYRMWKELTLNASTDETQYRVWDYPIREQYGHILLAINDSMPVATAEEGFRKVNEQIEADFAFIHDSSEIKYEISKNCNLTEVGEVFAEKPYAVAVQQGSHLQDEISKTMLDLQKDRFFEQLQAKYWNHSMKGNCANADDSEGITLESLGGVFIATLFGLALAMITLAGEVLYYRRKRNKKAITVEPQKTLEVKKGFDMSKIQDTITIGTTFNPIRQRDNTRISNITLYPRGRSQFKALQ